MAVVPCRELLFCREDFFSEDCQTRENVRSAINEHFYSSDLPTFSPEILEAMIKNANNGGQEKVIKERLLQYIKTKKGLIGYAVMEAKSEFLRHESLKIIRAYEQRGLKEIEGLISLSEEFYKRLPKIDFYQSPAPHSPQVYLYHWLSPKECMTRRSREF